MKPGWNQRGPTVHLDSTRDRINLRSSKIHLQLEIPSLARGITDFLRPFGTLYHGGLDRTLFLELYHRLRKEFFGSLKMLPKKEIDRDWNRLKHDDIHLFQQLKSAAFWLEMIQAAPTEKWRWPALGKGSDGTIILVNGRSRLIATGMTKKEPWKHLDFLIWIAKNHTVDGIMESPSLLASDLDLHQVLGLGYDDQEYHQSEECHMGIEWQHGQINFRFFNNAFDPDFTERTQKAWYNYADWYRCFQKPVLHVYTDWPEQIADSQDFWQFKIMGKTSDQFSPWPVSTEPGRLEWWARNLDLCQDPAVHVIYITDPGYIDLSDLVCWMDLNHKAFVERNGRFVLLRNIQEWRSTFIDICSHRA